MEDASGTPVREPAASAAGQLHDPLEGITTAGTIITGAHRDRIAAPFRPVLDTAIDAVHALSDHVSLYVYGSVATGMAVVPASDVDLFTVGLGSPEAHALTQTLSRQFRDLCRTVEVGAAHHNGYEGDHDEAYGNRVFLRHYCVHLSGPDLHSALPDFAADIAAARGFNGDIAHHAQRWRAELEGGADPVQLSRRLARKSLLSVAGLVSIRDQTWTTDRISAAVRWAEINPALGAGLDTLVQWSRGGESPDRRVIEGALDGVVPHIVDAFTSTIGLWDALRER